MEIVDIRINHYETIYKDASTTPHAVSKTKRKIKELHKTYMFLSQ